jgi:hypothetical protein
MVTQKSHGAHFKAVAIEAALTISDALSGS